MKKTKTTKKTTLPPSCAHPLDKRESRRPAKGVSILEVFRSRGLEGTYSIEEIIAYVESLKRESRGTWGCCANGSTPVRAPFDRAANDLRNVLLDEVIYEFWNSDIPF